MADISVNIDGEASSDAEAQAEALEAVSGDAVQIAETEAAAEIAVTQIRADTEIELRQMELDAQNERNDLAWHDLEMSLQAARMEVSSLTQERDRLAAELLALIPQPSLEAEVMAEPETPPMEVEPVEGILTPEPEEKPASPEPQKVKRVRFL